MKTIDIYQSLLTRSSFEHRCMNNTKKIYQHAGKCDDQQNFKDIIESALLSTTEGFIDKIPNVHMPSHQSRNQVLGNHGVYSQTYWMLNPKQQNIVLWPKNPYAKP